MTTAVAGTTAKALTAAADAFAAHGVRIASATQPQHGATAPLFVGRTAL